VTSLLIALSLNIIFLLPFLLLGLNVSMKQPISSVESTVKDASIGFALTYVIALYLGSIVLGFLLGFFPQFGLRRFLNRVGFVAFAEHPSVWDRIFDVRQPPERPITWLRLHLDDGRVILGHLRHSSEYIDKDKPFELYLESPHEWINGHWSPMSGSDLGVRADGLYVRLLPAQVAEFFFVEKEWGPNKQVTADLDCP